MMNQVFAMAARADAKRTLEEVKERHQDILEIERNILVTVLFLSLTNYRNFTDYSWTCLC